MKRIIFTNPDTAYCRDLANFLMCKEIGATPVVLEVFDDFDVTQYEGIAEQKSEPISQTPNFKFPEVAAWLEAYTGTFDFYLSLKAQLMVKGMLSDKQIAAVQRAIERDRQAGMKTPAGKTQVFSLEPGTTLFLTKFISTKIAQQAGHVRAHRVVEVLSVEAETEKAYRAKVRLSANRTSRCGICGLTLENKDSIAAGIGPICAAKYGYAYGESSLSDVAKDLSDTLEVFTWIPKKSIKERIGVNDGTCEAEAS